MGHQLRSERRDDGTMTLWLGSREREVVVLDSWLLDQMHLFFDDLERDPPAGLVVMSESPRVFLAGADLSEIESLDDEKLLVYLTEGAEAMARVSSLDCPTVAAVNGAALGGGLELAMHCDGLIAARPRAGSRPYTVGLPEASLGICPGWGGTQMLPARIEPAHAIRMAATGETRPVDEFPDGLFDDIVDAANLHDAAVRWLRSTDRDPHRTTPRAIDESNRERVREGLDAVRSHLPDTPAAHAVVEAVEIGIEEGFAAGLAAERRLLVSLRHTETARRNIAAFFARRI